jgi:hypothetical protein
VTTREIWPLNAAGYRRHAVHADDRAWPESNCAVDLWIELLHTAGREPIAALPFAFGIDFEGDQWTFFKPSSDDLRMLFGVGVVELNIWRSLVAHVETQIELGRPVIVEVDACFLPDTASTTYRRQHAKTSIAVQAIDAIERRAGYFHNAGYFELHGGDFEAVFRPDAPGAASETLPPYAEVAKLDTGRPLQGRALTEASLTLLASHLSRRPVMNPVQRFADRFAGHLDWLMTEPLDTFHSYAFATFRQVGSAFELGASYLRWLSAQGEIGLDDAASSCDAIAGTAKTLQFKTARAVNTRRAFDASPLLATMAAAWHDAMSALADRYAAEGQLT